MESAERKKCEGQIEGDNKERLNGARGNMKEKQTETLQKK